MLEYQRYGRNKDTVINATYINSGEYRRKFDGITNNKDINRILYLKAKEMLFHRSGTLFEDMYWIDADTGEVIASALDEKNEGKVEYSNSVLKAIQGKTNLITLHTHPNSMPPSVADFNSCFGRKYIKSLVICHNGIVYEYSSNQEISETLYVMYIHQFRQLGHDEREAQFNSLCKLQPMYGIELREV